MSPDFPEKDDTVFQIGVAPARINIVTGATGLEFEETFAGSVEIDFEGIPVRVPSINDLIRNKRSVGRTRDLADVEALEALRDSDEVTG